MLFGQVKWSVFSGVVKLFFRQKWLGSTVEQLAHLPMDLRHKSKLSQS